MKAKGYQKLLRETRSLAGWPKSGTILTLALCHLQPTLATRLDAAA